MTIGPELDTVEIRTKYSEIHIRLGSLIETVWQ